MRPIRAQPERPRLQQLGLLFAVAGLVSRAIIPLGYMPGNLLAGEFMVLCPTGAPEIAAVFGHGGHEHGGPDSDGMVDADRACPIGVAMHYAVAPPSEPSVAGLWNGRDERPEVAPPSFVEVSFAQSFRARAPPFISS